MAPYPEDNDTVFCHTRVKAFKELNMSDRNAKDAFYFERIQQLEVGYYCFSTALSQQLP